MKLHHRYGIWVVGVALLMTACEVSFDLDVDDPSIPPYPDIPGEESPNEPGYGIKPTVPLKRRPIVPKNKLPRPNIIERINWTAAGALAVTLAEDVPAVVTIIEPNGTMHSYVSDARGVEIADVPGEAFELQIDVANERYTVVVE
ncbi:MAG: hypothetical protein J6C56_06015 [Alistipes sp.]|nr:hypothetical protein [Alistipes sp.]